MVVGEQSVSTRWVRTVGHTYAVAHDPVVQRENVRFQKNREDGKTKVTAGLGRPPVIVMTCFVFIE